MTFWRASRVAIPAILSLAMITLAAQSATRVWTGAESSNWNNSANWTNGIIPVVGDSLEFPDDGKNRDTYNDLSDDYTIESIIIKGRNYTLRGNRINLQGGLISLPSNCTNRIALDINVNAPMSFVNHGYFNQLQLTGDVNLYHPLRLETGSSFMLTGRIDGSIQAGVTLGTGGTLIMEERSQIIGKVIVDYGQLIVRDFSVGFPVRVPIQGELVIGNESGLPGQAARVVLQGSGRIDNGAAVTIHRSGVLWLDGSQSLQGITETIGPLSGSGAVELTSGTFNVNLFDNDTSFAGEVRGTGEFQLQGGDHALHLGGHSGFVGSIHVWSGTLNLLGSASNAVVRLDDLSGNQRSVLSGNGVAKGLIASNAVVRPGPGTLRFLENLTLNDTSKLALTLDGPEAGKIAADSIDLGDAALEITYHTSGPENQFTLITANASASSTFHGLAEGTWLVAGDPGAPSEFRLTYSGNGGHDVVLERTGLFVPPTLNIRLSGAERVIEWPLAAQGYSLQRSLSIDPPDWTSDGLPAPDATATDFFVIDDSVDGERFYRLMR